MRSVDCALSLDMFSDGSAQPGDRQSWEGMTEAPRGRQSRAGPVTQRPEAARLAVATPRSSSVMMAVSSNGAQVSKWPSTKT
jgi:hypothetical protein